MRTVFKYVAAAIAVTAASISTAQAVEGAVQYPHGAEGFYAGALPPPGTHFLAYGIHYQGTRQDNNGNDAPDDVNLTVNAIASRVVHMTDKTILGANWGMHAIVPVFRNTLKVGATGFKNTQTGLGDITIDPLILAWHRPDLHYAFALDIIVPTGKYDKNRANNIGANYWSVEPLFAVTWLPGDGWELSGKFMYNYKFENNATNYQSGDEIHVDYTIGKTVAENWTAGLGGYLVHQIEKDERNGVSIDDSRAQVYSIGPQVKYQAGATSLIAKWHHEVSAKNAFQGDRVILKMVTPF